MTSDRKDTKASLVWRIVDGEALIVDLSSGYFFSLDPVGTAVWKALQEGTAVAEIVCSIAAAYGESEERVRGDVVDLIEELREAKLWEAE